MTNYRIIEDRAYELAEEDLSTKEIATRLVSIYGIGGNEAWDIAEMAVEDTNADREEAELESWADEIGYNPYEGCYDWDC